jgi:recombination endonuclease VII
MRPALDIPGFRNGRLLALWPVGRIANKSGTSAMFWSCQCDCGQISILAASAIKHKSHKQCRHNLGNLLTNGDYHRYWKHRILPATFKDMVDAQNNRCAICGDSFVTNPDIDHDHTCCGKKKSCSKCRRGLLCRQCNMTIGKMKESPALLRKAADYLEKWKH